MINSLRKLKTPLLILICCLLGGGAGTGNVSAESAADSYNYSYWGDAVAAPAAYVATEWISGSDLGTGAFQEPSDLHVAAGNRVYVLDSGNNRIVVLDHDLKLVTTVDSFTREGKPDTFLQPQGIFVTDDGEVLVADTGNKRVVHLDADFQLVKIIDSPESELLQDSFKFEPMRVVMDHAQRIYVMAGGVFDGFMEFNAEGAFTTFIGANRVYIDPIEYFWKQISTKAQRSQMVMFTPTEFTNLDIDSEGFIYATNGDQWGNNIKKLNAQGSDILRRTGYSDPQGDILYISSEGPSKLIDIDVTDSEIYSVLDGKRGRVFTYNGDGHLMYVFGGLGNQLGQFHTPAAIDRIGEDFLVLDKALGEITVFRTTEYGRTLNEAVKSYYRGEEETAFALFNRTIAMNANLDFAYAGIGKALLRQGDYKDAMKHFKRSLDQKNYSKAFLLYRKEVMREHFPLIMTVLFLAGIGIFAAARLRKVKERRKGASA
ncbi:hypothetical protein [Paenibacillus lautus]|uniref:Uncharacterized protein n=1 Tax=Paenibacillus lautus TaxID=1401 RepID=A0A385TPI2_PAELA|nr:hypothetical protein [Paenibacillus lautus]AYB44317.1 hypothetical protein D5F53_13905 [Paenibacillus lautus]